MSDSKQYTTFYLNGLFLGVEVPRVQEVIRYQEMTRVPLAPAMIEGLINLRGQIVTAIDLRNRFEMPARTAGQLPMNVIIRSEQGAVSLLVDEIADVVDVADTEFERPPDTLKGIGRQLVEGIYKLESRLLLILNIEKTLNPA